MRKIREIAEEIQRVWAKPHPTAVPYLEAMHCVDYMDDMYFSDKASTLVAYFLSNAGTFRGEDAKRIKAELKAMVG